MSRLTAWGRSLKQFLFRFVVFLRNLFASSTGFLAGVLVHFLDRIVWRGFFIQVLWQKLILGLYLGYGERPGRVLFVAVAILLGTAIAYWLAGTFVLDR